jgi:TIR domain
LFVSYSWQVEDATGVVERLAAACQARGTLRLIRDQTHLGYDESILAFMDRLGAGRHVVAVVSKAFLESEYCMYEMLKLSQAGELEGG